MRGGQRFNYCCFGRIKEYLEKQLSGELERLWNQAFVTPSVDAAKVTILNDENGDKYTSQVITPIISEGDL